MTEQEKELASLVTGEFGLLIKMREDNQFDKKMFDRIMELLTDYYVKNKGRTETSNVIAFNSIFLADGLAGGSRFFDENTAEAVEDASSELSLFFETIASAD